MQRSRFEIELEFIQALCNPEYLQYLHQKGFFKDKQFIDFLNYLKYWKDEPYCDFIMYIQCLDIIDLLTCEKFIENMEDENVIVCLGEQQLNIWNNKR